MSRKNLRKRVRDYIYDEIHNNSFLEAEEKINYFIENSSENVVNILRERDSNLITRISRSNIPYIVKDKTIEKAFSKENKRKLGLIPSNIKIRENDLFNKKKLRNELMRVEKIKENFPSVRNLNFKVWKKYQDLKEIKNIYG